MTSDEYGQILDDFELNAPGDVMPGESLTEYIERRRREFESKADGGSIGIEVLFMDKEPRTKMVSGGFLKGIGSLFKGGKDKIDDIIETKAMEKIGFRSRDDIPLSTYSEMKGPIKLSDMENISEDQLKKILRTQELGLYEETPELLKAANLLERFTKKVGGKRVIDYERAEDILNVKLKGNETLDELFKIEFKTRPENRLTDSPFKDFEEYVLKGENKAEGGRVGLFMGGPALEGQALDIYTSMKGYNFSDQEIADALSARGLYTAPGGGGGGGSEQVSGIIGTQLNRGDDNVTSIAPGTLQKQYQAQLNNPINNFLYETGAKIKASQPYQKSMNLGAMAIGALSGIPGLGFLLDKLGKDGNFNRGNIREMNTPKTLDATKFSDTSGINTDFGGVTVDDLGRIVQTGDYLTGENVMAGYNTGFDLTGTAFDRIDKINASALKRGVPVSPYNQRKIKALKDFAASSAKSRKDALQAEIERAQKIKDDAARAAATQAARVKSISEGYGGADDSPGATGPTAVGAGMGVGGGYASDYGFLKDGGLATMFTRRR